MSPWLWNVKSSAALRVQLSLTGRLKNMHRRFKDEARASCKGVFRTCLLFRCLLNKTWAFFPSSDRVRRICLSRSATRICENKRYPAGCARQMRFTCMSREDDVKRLNGEACTEPTCYTFYLLYIYVVSLSYFEALYHMCIHF